MDLERLDGQKVEAEQELDRVPAFESMQSALSEEEQRLEEFKGLHQTNQVDVETLRQRSVHLDQQLFGGDVANPRDLPTLEQEAESVRGQLEKQDGDLLELTVRMEESDNKCSELRQRISDTQSNWEKRQTELRAQLGEISSERESVSARRIALAADVEPAALQRYEALRLAKKGRAVAKVERGLCQECRMSLPTQHQQRVRSGRQIVQCSTCGRMLFLS